MAKKPFEIQNSTLIVGGVNLEAGATTIVIPGVTQASNYGVNEVNDVDDQTTQWDSGLTLYILDAAELGRLNGDTRSGSYVAAEYTATVDDDGEIDDIEVSAAGTFSSGDKTVAEANMWASQAVNAINNFNINDWTEIPFQPVLRPDDVSNISSGGIVQRTVEFPYGEEGDTRGTIALAPNGKTYICIADWQATTQPDAFSDTVTTLASHTSFQNRNNRITILLADYPDLEIIWDNPIGKLSGLWRVEGNNCGYVYQDGDNLILEWEFVYGRDANQILINDTFSVTFDTSPLPGPEIWRQLDIGGIYNVNTEASADNPDIELRAVDRDIRISANRSGTNINADINLYSDSRIDIYGGDKAALGSGKDIRFSTDGGESFRLTQSRTLTFPDGTSQKTAYVGITETLSAYKGFEASYARIYENLDSSDEHAISKIVIYKKETAPMARADISDANRTSRDYFRVNGLGGTDTVAMFVLYSNNWYAHTIDNLRNFAESAIDLIILNGGTEGNINTLTAMKDNFYSSHSSLANIASVDASFEFYDNSWSYLANTSTRTGPGSGLAVNIEVFLNNYVDIIITSAGSNYVEGQQFKILGGSLGGVDGVNDFTFYVNVDGSGSVTNIYNTAGTATGIDTIYSVLNPTLLGGTGADVFVNAYDYSDDVVNNIIEVGTNNAGSNYRVGDVLTVLGTAFSGGTTPANDITFTVTAIGVNGSITALSYTSGTIPAGWRDNSISDGGLDQYDTANYIFTSITGDSYQNGDGGDEAIPYNRGAITSPNTAFGPSAESVVVYKLGIFGIFARNIAIDWIGTNGNSGADGDSAIDCGSLYRNESPVFRTDGSIELPYMYNTGYEPFYDLNGPTLKLGTTGQQVIITGPEPDITNPDAQRLVIQGQKGFGGTNSAGEGGDIYLWAGVGGEATDTQSPGDGGDIKVRGGAGQYGGSGGYVKIEGGNSFYGPNGNGGYIEITAGDALANNGDGGDVSIKAGVGSGTGNNGEIHLYTYGTNNHWLFDNGGTLHLPSGGGIVDSNGTSVLVGADLVGNGGISQVGSKQVVYTDYAGSQAPNGGPTTTEIALTQAVSSGFAVGDVITFRTGEIRTITQVNDNTPSEGFRLFTWVGDVEYGSDNPMFPITVFSSNYVAATKPTARIKPDADYVGLGQYVDIYTGGAPSSMDDLGHIHMKGHHGNVELFLGTDDNFVSTKELGNTPGHVTMRSESEVKVIETDLRTHRNGSTFISDMGDSENYTWHRTGTADISLNTVAVDTDGNYYVGGEHQNWSDAMISKFSKDGSLIWSKIVGGTGLDTAYDVPVVAVNPTTNTATILYTTDINRNNSYFKMVDLDADGNFDSGATDFYDTDGSVRPRDMKWHSTLGWIIVGITYGDELASSALNPQTGSGVGKLILNAAATDLRGDLMTTGDTSWYLGGTNITGKQLLDQGIGLFTGLTPTNLLTDNPAATGATIRVRINYSGVGYFGLSGVDIAVAGTDYTTGDIIKIPGSQLGGVDGFTVELVDTVVENNNPGANTVTIKAPKLNHAALNAQVGNGSPVIGFGIPDGATITNFRDFDASYWAFDVVGDFTPTGAISVLHLENDVVFTVSASLGGITGSLTTSGTPELTNITINTTVLGYTTEDFGTGTYTVYKQVNARPFVWTSTWKKFLDMEVAYDYGYATAVDVDVNDVDAIYVSGYTNGSRNGTAGSGFLWKLTAAGATSWIRGLDTPWEISSIAVAADGNIYAASNGMGSDIAQFSSSGTVLNRIGIAGLFGGTIHVDTAQGEDGLEYVFAVLGAYGAMGLPMQGMAVQKFTLSLEQVWSRTMVLDSGINLNVNYDSNYKHFALTPTQAVVVGYGLTLGNSFNNGQLWSISITDDFEPTLQLGDVNGVITSVADLPWEAYGSTASDNLGSVLTAQTSTIQTAGAQATFSWNPYTWSNRIINANFETKGLVGIEKIDFVQGGYLGHNPADIPHSSQNLQANDSMNWNITLNLMDRGKFIKNMATPTHGSIQDLTIYVPKTADAAFPVGSIITLINLDTTNTYWIDVEPVGFNADDDAPVIWASGQTISTKWGFKGLQTATLMKIGTNDWLLTANNIMNRDI